MQKVAYTFLILFLTLFHWSNSAILAEKPDFLETCHKGTTEFKSCITKAFQHLYAEWKNGIPGITDTTPIDPLLIKESTLIDDKNIRTPLLINIKNLTATGIGSSVIKDVSFKDNEYSFKMTYHNSKLRIDGDYTAQGNVMLLKLNAAGKMYLEITNAYSTLNVKVKLRSDGVHKFFDVKSVRLSIDSIELLHIYLSNIFKDKELTKSINEMFNQEWRAFFESSKPSVTKEIVGFQTRHLRRIFKAVPAEYFIADVLNE